MGQAACRSVAKRRREHNEGQPLCPWFWGFLGLPHGATFLAVMALHFWIPAASRARGGTGALCDRAQRAEQRGVPAVAGPWPYAALDFPISICLKGA